MKEVGKRESSKPAVTILLLIALLSAFYVGAFDKAAEAQQNYPAPVITGISPGEAEAGESAELSIMGEHFLEGAKLSFIPSAGISVSWVKVLSPEKIMAGIEIAKEAPTGPRDVTITNPDQRGCTAKASFSVKTITPPLPLPITLTAPTITSVSPAEADAGETVEIVISGKDFTADAQISFSPPTGISLVSLKSVSPGEVRAVISIAGDAPAGARDVTLTNSDGQSYTVKAGFRLNEIVVPVPAVTSVAPGEAKEAEAEKVPEPPAPVVVNVPKENKIQQARKSFHRLITGVANNVMNWVAGLKIKMTDKAIENIQGSAFSRIKPSLQGRTPCPEPPVINYQTMHVSSPKGTGKTGADSAPDGSAARPFPNIAEALARAEELHYEGVEIIVGRGTYVGGLLITRPTRIIGESRTDAIIIGSITNNSVHSLTLDSLSIAGPKTIGGEEGKEGALVISNVCASTTLRHVNIESPLNYGVFQNGGELSVSDVRISDTAAAGGVASSGTAIHLANVDAIMAGIVIERSGRFAIRQIGGSLTLSGALILDTKTREELSEAGTSIWTSDGAKTDISGSIINGSRSSALIIQGIQTEAFLRDVVVSDTRVNPYLMQEHVIAPAPDLALPPIRWRPGAYASIEVQQEAQLNMEQSRVTGNEYIGLRVTDNAQARVTNTRFSLTRSFPGSEDGGINIQAKDNGYIYLENVTSSHADLIGVQLYRGTADYHIGEVSYNLVGAHVTTTGFAISRLMDRVVYSYNARDLDTVELPVPESSAPAGE